MDSVIDVEMLPAGHGDALIVRYAAAGDVGQMLIDGGPSYSYPALYEALIAMPPDRRVFEVLVITHIDGDHIDGIVRLLQEDLAGVGIVFKDVWFNGAVHAEQLPDKLGAKQGEYLQALIESKGLPWNEAFGGGPVLADPQTPISLPSGAKVRILSPTTLTLRALFDRWERVLDSENLPMGNTEEALARLKRDRRLGPIAGPVSDELGPRRARSDQRDRSVANGSSIAFVLEVGDRRVLLAGDAHHDVLETSIGICHPDGQSMRLDAFKVPHHGSSGNMSTELLRKIDCRDFLISTNGSFFDHPDAKCIELLMSVPGAQLWFNYSTKQSVDWSRADKQKTDRFHFPSGQRWVTTS